MSLNVLNVVDDVVVNSCLIGAAIDNIHTATYIGLLEPLHHTAYDREEESVILPGVSNCRWYI